MFQKQIQLLRRLCHLGLDACGDQHTIHCCAREAKPHYLEHTCLQNKEPGQFNLRCAASVVDQINFCKMEIKAFDETVIVQHISLQKNTLPWWYVFVTVGRVFCHACTSMTNLWQNQDSHTCAVIEVFHDITKIIITEVSTSMTINRASQKCFRQGWPTRGIHHNGTPLSYRVGFWIR